MTHHHHDHSHENGEKNIKTAFFLNFGFTLLEVVGGILTNSMAILSDALHDLGDSLSLGFAWYFEKKSIQKPDDKFSYGYSRFSLLGAVINSLVLVGGSALVLTKTIPRIFAPEPVVAEGMLAFAIVGIIVNLAAMLRLQKGSSLNQKTVSWHLLEDVLGWAVVLIASIILMFFDVPIIDPILSAGITVYVLYNAIRNLVQIIKIFLQGVPPHISIDQLKDEIEQKFNVQDAYHMHIWSLDGEKNLLTMHIVVADDMPISEIASIKKGIRAYLSDNGIYHATIEVEHESEDVDDGEF
ncbi:MAG: cation diffusion facilitator family transporter [Eubacteriales bacterium]